MVTSVNASSGASAYAAPAAASGRALSADLAQSEVKLSDWTHCVSAKTPEGKEKIAELGAKVDAIKAKMKAAEEAKADDAPRARSAAGPLGNALDVYA